MKLILFFIWLNIATA